MIHQTGTQYQRLHYAEASSADAYVQGAESISQPLALDAALDWQGRAIAAYRNEQHQRMVELCTRLIGEVQRLTEQPIPPESIVVDREAGCAQVVLDGIRFELCSQAPVLVRACVCCGNNEFRSAPLTTKADLGYALVGWQPHCEACTSNSLRRRFG